MIPLPGAWVSAVDKVLKSEENVLAWLETDLDSRLHFANGLVIVTSRRLLSLDSPVATAAEWPLESDLSMHHHDHAGVGTLEILDTNGRVASWRFTLSQNLAALRVVSQFEQQLETLRTGHPPEVDDEAVCPKCKAPLPPGEEDCPICVRELHTPPSTWTLFRLWRFTKPYRWKLLSAFLLTLASTAATLVAPYMTMPIMDKILIPYQNGTPIDSHLVTLYLGGLLGASLLAWVLSWARTYILAWVSERIGADLRTTTYEHLLRLSQEYFGGKRTGDLMARIGSETDRINIFLSLHLLDFANDVLMIIMTSVILISINPWLALITLIPLPLIAWMIHVVRERLRTGFEKVDRIWAEVTNVLADTIPGIRVVKAFAQENREVA